MRFDRPASKVVPLAVEPQARPRLPFLPAGEVIAQPRPAEIVEGFAWQGCISVLVAESGIGKTFVLVDIAASVASHRAWHGRAVSGGAAAYVSFEGDALGLRLRALTEAKSVPLDGLFVLRAAEPLSPTVGREGREERSLGELLISESLEGLARDLRDTDQQPIRLLVLDTVRASLAGSEDRSQDVAGYLRAVRRLMTIVPHAAVVLAHHSGWQDGEHKRPRERGSSSWRGNADATHFLEAGEYDAATGTAPLVLSTLKTRDAERLEPLRLVRRRVLLTPLHHDDCRRGAPTSCVIDADTTSRADRLAVEAARSQTIADANDLRVLRAMRDVPAATSVGRLRPYVNLRTNDVAAAVSRLVAGRLAEPGRRGQPFIVTEAGLALLNGESR